MSGMVLSQRLAAGLDVPGGRRPRKGVCRGWRLAVRWDPQADARQRASVREPSAWRWDVNRQATWTCFARRCWVMRQALAQHVMSCVCCF